MKFRKIAYWFALFSTIVFSVLTLCFIVLIFSLETESSSFWGPSMGGNIYADKGLDSRETNASGTFVIATLTLILSTLGTVASIIFGWRADRRQVKELELKVKELEKKME